MGFLAASDTYYDPTSGLSPSDRFNIVNANYNLLMAQAAASPESLKVKLTPDLAIAKSRLVDAFTAISTEDNVGASSALADAEQKLNTVQAQMTQAMTPTGAVVDTRSMVSSTGAIYVPPPTGFMAALKKVPWWCYAITGGAVVVYVVSVMKAKRPVPQAVLAKANPRRRRSRR